MTLIVRFTASEPHKQTNKKEVVRLYSFTNVVTFFDRNSHTSDQLLLTLESKNIGYFTRVYWSTYSEF